MGSIWSAIRLHFGFEATERISLIFQKSTSSTANDLRIFTKDLSLLQDNLLRSNSIQHHGDFLTEDEGFTPTMEKFIVNFIPTKGLRWHQAFLYSRTTCVPVWRTGRGNLDVEVLARTPFVKTNYIAVPPAKRLIALADGSSFTYGSSDDRSTQKAARRAVVPRAPATSTTLWPGDYIEPELPQDLPPKSLHALEPHSDIPQVHLVTTSELLPPPGIISSVAGRIRIPNLSCQPIQLKRHEHFCQVSLVFTPSTHEQPQHTADLSKKSINLSPGTNFSSAVGVDPHNL